LTRSDFTDTPIVTQGFVSPRGWNNASVGAGGGRGVATQYTEELQLNGKALGGNLQYTLGGYLRYFTAGPQDGQITTGSSALGAQILVSAGGGGAARTQAAYLQGTYDLGGLWDVLDGLKFTGGVRYNFDYATETQHIKVVTAAGLGPFPLCVGGNHPKEPSCNQFDSGHFESPGWNLSLDYQLDPETLLYVRSSKGYRPGGFTPSAAKQGDRSYQPENLVDVEVGAKADWELLGMRARTNVDAFHAFYSDIQVGVVSFVLVDGAETNLGTTENAAEATAEGIEWDGSLFPTKDLELKVNGSFNHNVFDKFNSAFFGQLKGRSFAGFPKFKIDLGFTYHLPIDETVGDVALTADWSYQTHYFLATDNGPSASPTHRLLNWRIDWDNIYGEPVDLGFFMTNATDATFVVGSFGLYNQQGFTSFVYNEPREFGMELKYRFEPSAPEPEATPAPYVPPPVAAVTQAPKSYLVFFDFNKSDLTPQAVLIVDQAASNAGPAKVTRLTVTGHTDTVGSDAYNMRLSRRRAESVASQLEKDGIPSSEIEIVAKGKRDLLVPTADGVREPQNRRVQIVYDGAGA
jgi:iron complex outermembrane receptor protein